jgi:hypothetical protein
MAGVIDKSTFYSPGSPRAQMLPSISLTGHVTFEKDGERRDLFGMLQQERPNRSFSACPPRMPLKIDVDCNIDSFSRD